MEFAVIAMLVMSVVIVAACCYLFASRATDYTLVCLNHLGRSFLQRNRCKKLSAWMQEGLECGKTSNNRVRSLEVLLSNACNLMQGCPRYTSSSRYSTVVIMPCLVESFSFASALLGTVRSSVRGDIDVLHIKAAFLQPSEFVGFNMAALPLS